MADKFSQRKGHSTAMAGEFCVMEKLFRLGHEAALTIGSAKSIDILTKSPTGVLYEVSVKAIQGGGKWGIGKENVSQREHLVYVLLWYSDFGNVLTQPQFGVIPAKDAEHLKHPWFNESYAIFCSSKEHRTGLEPYKDAWYYLK